MLCNPPKGDTTIPVLDPRRDVTPTEKYPSVGSNF